MIRHIALALPLLFSLAAFGLGNDSMRGKFVVSGDRAYFPAAPRSDALELWITDGTPAGTHSLADLGGGSVTALVPLKDGVACFVSSPGRLTLWVANRTAAVRVRDLGDAGIGIAADRNGQLLFSLAHEDPLTPRYELWQSDGTVAGTILLRALPRAAYAAVVAGELLYFAVAPLDPWADGALWRSDGTAAGTFSLERPTRGVLGRAGTSVLFDSNSQLWRNTDGTAAGSAFIANISPTEIVTSGGMTYVAADHAVWRTDGTPSGTTLLFSQDLRQASLSGLVVAGDNLYYRATASYYVYHVKNRQSEYVGTSSSIGAAAGERFFFGYSNARSGGFFVHDSYAQQLRDTFQASIGVVAFGDRVLFSADESGFEPAVSDGTGPGTVMLANIYPEATLRGSVLDAETGLPLPSVRVTVAGGGRTMFVAAGEDGRFIVERLPAGRYSVTLSNVPGHVPELSPKQVDVVGGEIVEVDFLLQRGGGIAGRVVDERGAPVAGVMVRLTSATRETTAFTAGDGTYVTQGNTLEPDTEWAVQTTDATFSIAPAKPRYSSVLYDGVPCWRGCDPRHDGTRVVPRAGQTLEGIDFVVKPLGKVSGRVVDSVTGEPILTGWTIEARGVLFPEGTPEQVLPAGPAEEYVVQARDGGTMIKAFFAVAPYRTTTVGPILVEPGAFARGYDIPAPPIGARIHVRATDAQTGQAVRGASVRIIDAAGKEVQTGLTTSNGTYRTAPTLLPGTYTVKIAAHDRWAAKTATVSVSGIEIASVELPLQRVAVVTGIVRDAVTGQPLAGARVQLVAGDGFRFESTSDAGGHYSMQVSGGSYVARAVKGGWYSDSLTVTITGALDETTQQDFALAPACAPSITLAETMFPARGGTGRIELRAGCEGCTFSSSSFIHPPASCATTGTVTFTVDLNQGAERTGWIIVPGGAIQIRQAGGRGRSVGR